MAAGTAISPRTQRARRSTRFWYRGRVRDVVDGEQGNDSACRQSGVAISLDHPVLAESRWEAV
jgi:hypothetical protein